MLVVAMFSGIGHAQTVTGVAGDVVALSQGSAQGVRAGMTGRLCTDETVGEVRKEICDARFEVTRVRESSSTARVTRGDVALVQVGYRVSFDQALRVPRSPEETSRSEDKVGTAGELLARGNRLFDVKDWPGAAAVFRDYLRRFKNSPDAGYVTKLLAACEERILAAGAVAEEAARQAAAIARAGELTTQAERLLSAEQWAEAWQRSGEALALDAGNTRAQAAKASAEAHLGLAPEVTERQSGVRFQRIPSGDFTMGCAVEGENCTPNDNPAHLVAISKPFYIAESETTVGQYRRFASVTRRSLPPAPPFAQTEGHPVVNVSWEEAKVFCEWVGGRLPTEAEWEYSARGGLVGTRYTWGNEEPTCSEGSRNGARYYACGRGTTTAKSFEANGYGLYDMTGNAGEWVADWYEKWTNGNRSALDPVGPPSGGHRVVRGGSWYDGARGQVVDLRGVFAPGTKSDKLGFRCARTAIP